MKYVRDMGWKKDPEIAKERAALARIYRKTREFDRHIARLLYSRYRTARNVLIASIDKNVFGP